MSGARPDRWNLSVIALHWISAALMSALIAIGWAMTHGVFGAARAFELFQLHKSLGFLMFALTFLRLASRLAFRAPPARTRGAERALAAATQALLYALTLAAILAGWLAVSYSPLPIPTSVFGLFVAPDLASPDPTRFAAARLAHQFAAYATLALVALHVAGALAHHFVERDDVLTRMTPRFGRAGRNL